jgi:HAD superfamily hydrolase (TIGR01509 family)
LSSRTSLDRLCRRGALDALLCDLDGTLVDSKPALRAVYGAFVRAHGGVPSDAEFATLDGPSVGEIVARLRAAHGLGAAPEALERDYRARVSDAYRNAVGPMPGAGELVAQLRPSRVRAALVTSGYRDDVAPLLARTGWSEAFAAVVCGDDVARSKPAPDLYVAALRALAVVPAAALAVEDSAQGVAAARAAGVRVVAIGEVNADAQAPDLATLCRALFADRPALP